jgi:hypothetical protein
MPELESEIRRFGRDAFAMTVTAEARPHVAPVQVTRTDGDVLEVLLLPGSRTERNAAVNSTVCLHWPGTDATDGYSLIVDGEASLDRRPHDTVLRVMPSKAVLHKLGAPGEQTNACGHDCVGVDLPALPRTPRTG